VKGFDFDIRIQLGAGAYVCGEESALLQSLEGFRGEPRNRPPFPVEAGLFGRPSVVNNVETLAWVTCILANGAGWFRKLGSEKSPGLKLLSVSGDCERPGVYEAPLGVTIAELLAEVGGAGAKAVQIGGASGCCVPASQFHRRIAYEDVSTGGAVVVFGPGRDMLRVAHNFLEFFVDESCGQCTPCRVGTRKLLETVELLRDGQCSAEQLDEIRALAQTSPSAFLSILEHFPDELLGRPSLPASPSGVRQ
jgi:[NiFe] hydrogenase diaphorase moiety large subunit